MSITLKTTTKLGGTASRVTVGKVAHGLMTMTHHVSDAHPDEQLFEAIKAGVDALPPGTKMVLNSAEFYGPPHDPLANLAMLSRFYEANPEYVDKTFLMVKGAMTLTATGPRSDSSMEGLRKSVNACSGALRGTKKIDAFQPARIDHTRSIEEAVRNMVVLKEEGKFEHIGLSECKAETLRRAHAVHPLAVVEIEVSIWSYEEETRKVIATASELGVVVTGYSPLGHGFLTGQIKSLDDIPADDWRRRLVRVNEYFDQNMVSISAIRAIADRKGIQPSQLAIAWVAHLGPHVLPLPGMSSKKRTLENLAGGDAVLTEDELKDIAEVMEKYPVQGHRYFGDDEAVGLWG
ncbi:Aldo/keto reductase [Daedalea quercina L-15889]|uniref:Aldo/keto reductase n=1 Tax=Daedalea quercina L-15889 TaxID=1314783 RepID=A0A165QW85_9APHY|nr:Aldo/keto reductase [Daedalea quercina L-15889]